MTQMESPKRKMQKKNDYQRHKLFRKIKRRRKAQAKADQQVAMKQLRKKLKLPKFGDGKDIESVEAAINYLAMIMNQNGYDASGYYDKVSKIGKAMTTLSPIRQIGTLRGTGMPWEESNWGLYGGYGETGRAADQLFDMQYDLPFHIQDHKINIGLGRTPTPLENKIYPQLLQFYNSGKDINIKPSKRGTFTKAAKQHGMSVQGFANRVLRNPSKYSATMKKKANFARNASKWNK